MLRRYKNTAPPVLLEAEVTAGETSLDVGDTSNFPDKFPFVVAIERGTSSEEACLVTSKTATELVVERGFDGTTAQFHPGVDSSGDTASLVEHTTAAIDYREAQIPYVTEAERDALDTEDEEDVWDGRMVYNADRRSVEVAHYDEVPSFIEWAGIVPTGTILPFSATSVPTGFLLCDGAAHLRADFPALSALYEADAFPFGNGDGSTTFNVPNLRQRFPLGIAASGTGSSLGASGGSIDHTHNIGNHTHSGPSHSHNIGSTGNSGAHAHNIGATGSSGAHAHNIGATGNAGGHSHNFSSGTSGHNHSHSGSVSGNTGAASSNQSHTASGGFSTPNASHVHNFFDNFGTNSSNHSHNVSGATSNTGTHAHNNGNTGNVGNHAHNNGNTGNVGSHSHNNGNTGSAGTGSTGSSGGGNTGTDGIPPFLALNFIVKT